MSMNQRIGVIAAVSAFVGIASANAQPQIAVITGPDWLAKPELDDFARVWPQGVPDSIRTVTVRMNCHATNEGTLTDCTAAAGVGLDAFSQAALKLAHFYRMKPKMGGRSVEGAEVVFPVTLTYTRSTTPR